jgi:hypothetical protein
MARLAALVPSPRRLLTGYHGVFAPHSSLRAAITAARCGPGRQGAAEGVEKSATAPHVVMSWARRLKRVSAIEIGTCAHRRRRL